MNRGKNHPPCAALLRVGLDSDLGGIWAPITDEGEITDKRRFEFIPFPAYQTRMTSRLKPESELKRFGLRVETYGDLSGLNHPNNRLSDFLPNDEIRFRGKSWSPPEEVVPHNDPDFRYATFGDYWKSSQGGRLPSLWQRVNPDNEELFIFFVETLAPFPGESTFSALRSQQRRAYGIYIVGVMRVAELIDISVTGWSYAIDGHANNKSAIVGNFHFKRLKDEPVIVVGERNQTFLAKEALPLKVKVGVKAIITEAGELLGVTEKDQVRLKFLNDLETTEKILGMLDDC